MGSPDSNSHAEDDPMILPAAKLRVELAMSEHILYGFLDTSATGGKSLFTMCLEDLHLWLQPRDPISFNAFTDEPSRTLPSLATTKGT